MNVNEIRKKAREMGIKIGNMKKAELIRSIQAAEGNSTCFGTAVGSCDQTNCCWMSDCLPK